MSLRTRRTQIVVTALGLLLVLGIIAIIRSGPDQITVTADFTRTTGLYTGNDVTVLGVPVGSITAIRPDGPVVHVTMTIDKSVRIPATATALVMQRSLVTDRYIEFTPAYASGPTLSSGAHLPLAQTRSPVGMDDVLASINRLLDALKGAGTASVGNLITATAHNFAGLGGTVHALVTGLRALTQTGAASAVDLSAIVRNLDTFTQALLKRDALIRQFSGHLTDITVQFASDRVAIARAVHELGFTMDYLTTFVRDNQAALGRDLGQITALTKTMLAHQAQLISILKVTPNSYENVIRTLDKNGNVIVNANLAGSAAHSTELQKLCSLTLKQLCSLFLSAAQPSGSPPLSLSSLLAGLLP